MGKKISTLVFIVAVNKGSVPYIPMRRCNWNIYKYHTDTEEYVKKNVNLFFFFRFFTEFPISIYIFTGGCRKLCSRYFHDILSNEEGHLFNFSSEKINYFMPKYFRRKTQLKTQFLWLLLLRGEGDGLFVENCFFDCLLNSAISHLISPCL